MLAGSREVRPGRAFGRPVAGREVVAWRSVDGTLHAGPGACPHLGAALCDAPVVGDSLVCRWHGMPLGPEGRRGWRTFATHDDGALVWVRLGEEGQPPTDAPVLGPRPPADIAVATVATVIGRCEPEDVVANRLDPWHGAWFHPYSFTALRVLSAPPLDCPPAEDRFLVEVTFTVGSRYGIPVYAEFSCPEPRTVTMEIVDGEGAGSVVETHATPLRPGPDGLPRTAVIEAVIAHSERRGLPARQPGRRGVCGRWWRRRRSGCGATTSPTPSAATPCAPRALTHRPAWTAATSRRPVGGVSISASDGGIGAISFSGARRPRIVCTMSCCQPPTVWHRTSTNPASRSRCASRLTPSNCSTLRHR